MKRWTAVLASFALLGGALGGFAPSAQASRQQQWLGVDQDFVLTWSDRFVIGGTPCEIDSSQGGYVSNGVVSGSLYLRGCDRADTIDQFGRRTFTFIDTTGVERCMGEVSFVYNADATTGTSTWNIDHSVPGFDCRSVGQTVEVNIYRQE
ncbi:MAG: hypothetical protein AAFQ95_08820 [Cyanobacteria bacterium J06621_3]